MEKKQLKSSEKNYCDDRECSSGSPFTFSTLSDVFLDSTSTTTDESSVFYWDLGRTSRVGVKVNENKSYMKDHRFSITKRDLKNAEYDNFILQILDTGRTSHEVPFPQMWKDSNDLLRIKHQASQQWPGSAKIKNEYQELWQFDSESEEQTTKKSNIISTLEEDIVDTTSPTPDSFIWNSFPQNETTKLLIKVGIRLQLYLEAGLLEEHLETEDSSLEVKIKNPPPITRRKLKTFGAFLGCPRCIIS